MDENTQAKFEEKVKGLLAVAKKKKNVLEYQEIVDYFADMALGEEQFDKILEALEQSGVDVLRIVEDDVDDEEVIKDPEVLERAKWRLNCIRRAVIKIPAEYRQSTLDCISYNVPYGDMAHENTWRKWRQVLIWELAKNLFLI